LLRYRDPAARSKPGICHPWQIPLGALRLALARTLPKIIFCYRGCVRGGLRGARPAAFAAVR
jgi:hypothetical protein